MTETAERKRQRERERDEEKSTTASEGYNKIAQPPTAKK